MEQNMTDILKTKAVLNCFPSVIAHLKPTQGD